MKAILVKRAESKKEEGPDPDAVVESLAEVLSVVKDWMER